ncbi:MAG TPA: hypothetical protein VMF07_09100 [Solirubrobacteraceae bacterium]|nr:hypothetical protein [Solirubrobacteraceae bacterium]
MSASIWLVNLAVLAAVLGADLGTREITRRRILRPLIVSAIAVAVFVKSPQTSGTGLALELAGFGIGLALGVIGSHRLMSVRQDGAAGTATSVAGTGYAAFWTAVIGARVLFSYGAEHWYSAALGQWLAAHQVTVAGLTDTLILLAIGMVLARVMRFARVLGSLEHHGAPAGHHAVSSRS